MSKRRCTKNQQASREAILARTEVLIERASLILKTEENIKAFKATLSKKKGYYTNKTRKIYSIIKRLSKLDKPIPDMGKKEALTLPPYVKTLCYQKKYLEHHGINLAA